MSYDLSSILILALPLLSFIGLSLFGKRLTPRISGIIGTSVLFIIAILAGYVAYEYFFVFGNQAGAYVPHSMKFSWLQFNE